MMYEEFIELWTFFLIEMFIWADVYSAEHKECMKIRNIVVMLVDKLTSEGSYKPSFDTMQDLCQVFCRSICRKDR